MPPPGSPPPQGQPGFDPARPVTAPPPPGYPPPPPPGHQQTPPGYAAFTPHNPGTNFGPLASFGTRLGAWLIDSILYSLALAAAAIPGIVLTFSAFDECSGSQRDNEFECLGDELQAGALLGGILLIGLAFLFIAFIYIRALANTGQSWGRKAVGVKVIDERTGEPPGWGKAIGRTAFAWFISAQIFYIGYLWMLWDERKQTLHDKVAGTHVITV